MHEQLFEEHYHQSSLRNSIIGIEFSDKRGRKRSSLMLWESVLRNLSMKLFAEGAKPICMEVAKLASNDGDVPKYEGVYFVDPLRHI